MPLLARHLAFAASFILIGAVADAAPSRRVSHREVATAKQRQKAPPVDTERDEIDDTADAADDDAADDDAADGDKRSKHEAQRNRTRPRRHKPDASDTHQVGFKSED